MKLAIINGPNLNLLGTRQPEIYGNETFESYLEQLKADFPQIQLDYFQSNVEGELINHLQQVGFDRDGIVLNAAGFTHTSIAIGDAVAAITAPVVELHISNVYAREEYRHQSLMAKHCKGIISGFGLEGYRLAIQSF